ncbi:MAG: TonB-dependent receptor [Betaproteobacteria bacterium]|nr:MAG: TonB-dependent receptor [Betaproteobacteria bacterium]
MSKSHFAPAVLSGLACIVASGAQAQQAPAPAESAASAPQAVVLEQVVVTSQKRREDVRKVPLSVSVLSGDTLQENHITDLTDLTRSVPNVSFSSQAGAGLSTIEIRGISSQAGSATVSVYLDDVSLTTRNIYSQGTAEPRFFDIDRVEVLRGPQGTLYGASSLGGTIKFISKQPDSKTFSGNATTEVSSTSHGGTNYMAQGIVNVPLLNERIGLRLGVQSGHDSGYINQVDPSTLKVIDKGINSTRWDVLKLALKAELAPGWSATPALFAQRYKSDDIDAAYLSVGGYQVPAGITPPTLGLFQTSKIVREPATDRLTVTSLTLNGNVGFGDLTGILSGYSRRFDRIQDGTAINVPYIASVVTDPTLGALVATLPSAVQLNNKIDQTSLELRLASKDYEASRGPLTWVGGIYLAQTKTQVFDNEPVFGINAAFTAAGRVINDPNELAGSFPGAFNGDSSYYSARHYNDKQSSIFGEATYHASDTLRGIVGLRVLRATQHFTREGAFFYTGGAPSTAVIDSSSHAVTPRLAVDWDVNPSSTLYGNIAKGFRLGAANRPVPSPAANPLVGQDLQTLGLPGTIPEAFKPDSLWSYEVGSKSRLLDNRLSLNMAAYYIDWKDIQQDVVLPASGFDFETNVGRAKSYGFEVEARLRATAQLTVSAAASWTRAVFAEDMPALGSDANGLNVRKGDMVQGVPKYGARLGFEYHFRAMSSGDAFVRGVGVWTGPSHGSFVRSSTDYQRPAYFTADASAGLGLGKWEFTLFVKNIGNYQKPIQQPSVQGVYEALYLRPRTIGATASYDF